MCTVFQVIQVTNFCLLQKKLCIHLFQFWTKMSTLFWSLDLKFSGTQCIKSKLNSVTNIREKSWHYNEDIMNSICFLWKVIKVIIFFFLSNQVILMVVLVLWPYVIFWHTGAANCPNLFWTRVSQPTNPPREIPFLWELESLLASS